MVLLQYPVTRIGVFRVLRVKWLLSCVYCSCTTGFSRFKFHQQVDNQLLYHFCPHYFIITFINKPLFED